MGPGVVDFAVVGAGIAGASLAWRLALHGEVVVIERESQPGYHTTGSSAAMFMPSYGTAQVRSLTRACRAFYAAPPADFASVPLLSPRGVMYVGWDPQRELLDATLRELAESDPSVERIDAGAALSRVSVLRRSGLWGAIVEPDACGIDVDALLQGYLRGMRRRGGTLLTDAALLAATRGGGVWTLRLAGDRVVHARWLVNAAGAWADAVATLAGAAPFGLQPKRRSAFTFDAPAGVDTRDWPAVVGIDESWYFKPEAGGLLLGSPANADAVSAHDVVAEEIDVATGIARIEQATTMTIRRPRRTWAGLRTFARDGDLVIGADPKCEGLFWLAGQGGYGIQSAHAAAALAVSQLLGAPLPDELESEGVRAEAFAPGRLAA